VRPYTPCAPLQDAAWGETSIEAVWRYLHRRRLEGVQHQVPELLRADHRRFLSVVDPLAQVLPAVGCTQELEPHLSR
jgi:hypothetical protein